MLNLFIKGEKLQFSCNLKQDEIDCHCGRDRCFYTLIDERIISYFQKLRDKCGHALIITSGFRCSIHNENVGGVAHSHHCVGSAIDVALPDGYEINAFAKLAKQVGFQVITYPEKNFVHLYIGD